MNSFLHRIGVAQHSYPILLKILSFGIIGVGNTIVDLGVFTFTYKVIELPLVASNVLAWFVAVSGSYLMNAIVTFRDESGQVLRGKDYLRFVVSGILGVTASTATLVVLSHHMSVIAAKLIAILAGFAVNFSMSHFIVFRPRIPPKKKQGV
jgi:putative flippase GtrA